jgi:hypothetical protein
MIRMLIVVYCYGIRVREAIAGRIFERTHGLVGPAVPQRLRSTAQCLESTQKIINV